MKPSGLEQGSHRFRLLSCSGCYAALLFCCCRTTRYLVRAAVVVILSGPLHPVFFSSKIQNSTLFYMPLIMNPAFMNPEPRLKNALYFFFFFLARTSIFIDQLSTPPLNSFRILSTLTHTSTREERLSSSSSSSSSNSSICLTPHVGTQ